MLLLLMLLMQLLIVGIEIVVTEIGLQQSSSTARVRCSSGR